MPLKDVNLSLTEMGGTGVGGWGGAMLSGKFQSETRRADKKRVFSARRPPESFHVHSSSDSFKWGIGGCGGGGGGVFI